MSSVIAHTHTSQRQGEARSQAILDAAIEPLAEVGFDRMTMDEVLPDTVIMHIVPLGPHGGEAFIRRLVDDVLLPLLTTDGKLDGGF